MNPLCGFYIFFPCPLNGIPSCLKISLLSPALQRIFLAVKTPQSTVAVKPVTSPMREPDSGLIAASYPLFSPNATRHLVSADQRISLTTPLNKKCSLCASNFPLTNFTIVTLPLSSPNATRTLSEQTLTQVILSRLVV